jgi:hypothetical protein
MLITLSALCVSHDESCMQVTNKTGSRIEYIQGVLTNDQIEETYKITRRIEAEERALDAALMVITSTQQEVDMQWGLYDGYNKDVVKALNNRHISGHAMPFMYVCPPGLDFSSLKVGALYTFEKALFFCS